MTVDPLKQHQSLIKAVEDVQRLYSPAQQLAEQLSRSTAFLTAGRSGIDEALKELQRRQELLQPSLKIQRLLSQMRTAQEMANELGRNFSSSITSIHEQSQKWSVMIDSSSKRLQQLNVATRQLSGIAHSIVAWESSTTRLAQRMNEVTLIASRAQLSARLFAPSEAFTKFAHHTLEKLESASTDRQAWALHTSLQLAEEQLITTTETLDVVIKTPEDDDSVSESRELSAPYAQQKELLEASETLEGEDTTFLISMSPAVTVVDMSRRILRTIATCNEARKVNGDPEIFKPTTKLLEVYSDMPWLVPDSKHSFAQFVDCLYFLFYEGAGKDNLRFLKSHGGPIPDDDFEFILCIKHLRNKWTRHDADHGKDRAIAKSWEELAARFRSLGLPHMPVSADDFRLLHLNLLSMANKFVQKLLRGLTDQE